MIEKPIPAPTPSRTALAREKLKAAEQKVRRMSMWRHYKGGIYEVLGHAIDTDTGEVRVRYSRVAGPGFNPAEGDNLIDYVRHISEWDDKVTLEEGSVYHNQRLPGPMEVPRFEQVKLVERYETDAETRERG